MLSKGISIPISQAQHVLIIKLVDKEVAKCLTNNLVIIFFRSRIELKDPKRGTKPEQADKEERQEGDDINTCFKHEPDIERGALEELHPFKELRPQEEHCEDGNEPLAQSIMRLP